MDQMTLVDALWTSAEAAHATGGRAVGRWTASGVAIDTRDLKPGDLFVALKDKRDGHEFVREAYAKGAAAALVQRVVDEGPSLVVSDTLDGLRKLAEAARERSPAHRVAVTGSVGKTSVKECLASVFARCGRAHASVKSFNNHWGAPLSLARMPRETERAVFEIGMNHAGEIRPLAKLVRPHVALVTRIAPAHLEALGSVEAIADAKAEIFEGLAEWGAAIIPGDDDQAARLGEAAGAAGAGWLVRFGTDPQAEARLVSYDCDATGGTGVVEVFGQRVKVRVPAVGAHWGMNAAAILAAAYLADCPLQQAAEAIADWRPGAGRGAAAEVKIPGGAITLVDDSYNANPASVAAALAALAQRPCAKGGRRIAAIGEMYELGPDTGALHAALAEDIEAAKVDLVFVSGPGARPLFEALPESRRGGFAETAEDVAKAVAAAVKPGDVVLVKGSNASRMITVVESLKTLAR